MARCLMMLLFIVPPFATTADEADPEPPGADAKRLHGEWELVSRMRGRRAMMLKPGMDLTLKIDKNRWIVTTRRRETVRTWKVDASKSPARIDLTIPASGRVYHGIYKLDGDNLTVATSAGERPMDFATAPSTLVYKRKKK